MQFNELGSHRRVTILPGEFYASHSEITICTLLGSCVSACLYDPANRVIGMNHFLLSNRRYAKEMPTCLTEAGRYGIHAMELLITDMLKLGAKRANLKAKAFGGGAIFLTPDRQDNFYCVGDVNIRFIREFLKNENIQLVSEDLGGNSARVVHFLFDDYSVHVKKIQSSSASNLVQSEHQYWLKSIESQEKAARTVEIWR